jgi:hypothetical protein
MKVQLRAVGIYFNRPIEFQNDNNDATVFTVLDEAQKQFPLSMPGGFQFVSTTSTNPSVVSLAHNFPGKYDFDGNGSVADPVDGATLSGYKRAPGIYELKEQSIVGGVVGWQYYVVRGGVVVSATPASRGFQSYASFPVSNGDLVIWRLVAIGTEPSKYRSLTERLA